MSNFKIGDRVTLSKSTEKGKITKINENEVTVMLDFGIEITCKPNELVQDINELIKGKVKLNTLGKPIITDKKEVKQKEVDLHIDPIRFEKLHLNGASSLQLQLQQLQLFIDTQYKKRNLDIIVIHGKGSGKLKNAVIDYLNNHPYVLSHKPANEWEYGNGAVEVKLK
jgi:DNA mismatch repair protein MutS2